MKKFTLCLMLSALFISNFLQAKPVDEDFAKQLGIRFIQERTNLRTDNVRLVYTEMIEDGTPCFYVFETGQKGFVIVSADDRMKPILGYSSESNFNEENINDGLKGFFEIYKIGLTYAIENDLERDEAAINDWESVEKTGKLISGFKGRDVAPLVSTTWNQSDIYNFACPEDPAGFGGHVKSGCVANAMCQLMNFWKWPNTGTGSHSYYCEGYNGTEYGTLSVDYSATQYQFELMPKFLDYTSPQAEIDAVSLLEFHAGVSVDMMYGATASGAYSDDVPEAFVSHFRYSNDMEYEYRYYYSTTQWCNKLRENLDAGMPMYYSGQGEGGHAFVCDGYQPNDFFHFNWGWAGFDNGFYNIDAMYLTYHYYTDWHGAIFNMHPNDEYYLQPQNVENVIVSVDDANLINTIEFDAPTQIINGQNLNSITSIELLRNNVLIHSFEAPQPGEHLTFTDELDKNGVNYYLIYPIANDGKGKAVTDTIMTGVTCDMTFDLHDSDGDGWLSPSISVLDSDGIIVKRLGLTEGSEETITIEVPDNDSLTLYWNYCNLAYSDEDDECSFEVYDHNNELVYASDGKPVVGPFAEHISFCYDAVDENIESNVSIYPNPADEYMMIQGIDVQSVRIYNTVGQLVSSIESVDKDGSLYVGNLEEGIYFVSVTDKGNKTVTKKLMVK